MIINEKSAVSSKQVIGALSTVYSWDFPTCDESDVKVYVSDEMADYPYTDFKIITYDKTKGGSLQLTIVPHIGTHLVIAQEIPFIQELDLTNQRMLSLSETEKSLDKLTLFTHRVFAILERCIKIPFGGKISASDLLSSIFKAKDDAEVSALNAKTSETNAKTSETKAEAKALESRTYAFDAEASSVISATGEINSKRSADAAEVSENSAKMSEDNAKDSADKARASELKAWTSEDSSRVYESKAWTSADNAKKSETNAKFSEDRADGYAGIAIAIESKAEASALAAKASEGKAKISADNAYGSASLANSVSTSVDMAAKEVKKSEANAKTSETNAKTSETNAKFSEEQAMYAKNHAYSSEKNAKTSETKAEASAVRAELDLATNHYNKIQTEEKLALKQIKLKPSGNITITEDGTISCTAGLEIQVVAVLPATGLSNVIYLVKKSGTGSDVHDEYVWIINKYELIGTTAIDLSAYYTKGQVDGLIAPIGTRLSSAETSLTTKAEKTALATKVDVVSGKGLSTNDFTGAEKTKLSGIESGAQVNKVTSVANKTGAIVLNKNDVGLSIVDNTRDMDKPVSHYVAYALATKVDVVSGKGLSTNDYTTEEKTKLIGLPILPPNDDKMYGMKNGKWVEISIGPAPVDGALTDNAGNLLTDNLGNILTIN